MISPLITRESYYGLYKITISLNTSDLSDDTTRMADFQRLVESTLMDTKKPAGMRSEGSRRLFILMTVAGQG
jgi:hypothetical protein